MWVYSAQAPWRLAARIRKCVRSLWGEGGRSRITTPFLETATTIFTPLWSSAEHSPRRGVQHASFNPHQLFSHRCGARRCSLHDEAYNTLPGNRNNYFHTAVEIGSVLSTTRRTTPLLETATTICTPLYAWGSVQDPRGTDGICIRRRHICPAGSEWIGCDSHQETSHMHHDPCRIWKGFDTIYHDPSHTYPQLPKSHKLLTGARIAEAPAT